MKTATNKLAATLTALAVTSSSIFAINPPQALRGVSQDIINPSLLDISNRWEAGWIAVPDETPGAYAVHLFRKTVELDQAPASYVINVSADNRYKLYVNGEFVSMGPARGDVYNWNYETVDIAPQMCEGRNVIAAMVWNQGPFMAGGQMSMGRTEFMVQGNSDVEKAINTDDSWLCMADKAYSPIKSTVLGYFAAGPQEDFDAAQHPWGWEQPEFDDSGWNHARRDHLAAPKGNRDYSKRQLVPRPIPFMDSYPERMVLRKAEGIQVPDGFVSGNAPLTIPAGTSVSLLLDNEVLTNGFPRIEFSKGKGAEISLGYAECLYEVATKPFRKGNRNEVEGKTFVGYKDRIVADGGEDRSFESLWWRTWRYLKLDVTTGSEPLTINDISSSFCGYPFVLESKFSAPEAPELSKMLEIGWRTARLCANETYMDCPYYEQLQYFGDARIQAMITLYNTSDTCMVRNLIEQGRQSMTADGITMSRYPSSIIQMIPSYSLSWTGIVYDYWMHRGDEDYLRTLLPQMRSVMSWFEGHVKPSGTLDYIPYWFFADWPGDSFEYGEAPRDPEGDSSYQDFWFILALDEMAQMEEAFGSSTFAQHWAELAARMREAAQKTYWDEERGLYADTGSHGSYSQHMNSLAVLAGMVEGEEATAVMEKTLSDPTLTQATIYFSYFVKLAMVKAGLGDRYLASLDILRDQMELGLTTWAEQPEPSRSDCHAWGASPNIFLYKFVLGINSDAPGFTHVQMEPHLCGLSDVSGSIPSPAGTIAAAYKTGRKGTTATITLPAGIDGQLFWKGHGYALRPGTQTLLLK